MLQEGSVTAGLLILEVCHAPKVAVVLENLGVGCSKRNNSSDHVCWCHSRRCSVRRQRIKLN